MQWWYTALVLELSQHRHTMSRRIRNAWTGEGRYVSWDQGTDWACVLRGTERTCFLRATGWACVPREEEWGYVLRGNGWAGVLREELSGPVSWKEQSRPVSWERLGGPVSWEQQSGPVSWEGLGGPVSWEEQSGAVPWESKLCLCHENAAFDGVGTADLKRSMLSCWRNG